MANVFAYDTQATSGKRGTRKLKAQYGDGYSQSAKDGINAQNAEWNFTKTDAVAVIEEIAQWLDDNPLSFLWTPPIGPQALWECDEYTVNAIDIDTAQITGTFRRVYR